MDLAEKKCRYRAKRIGRNKGLVLLYCVSSMRLLATRGGKLAFPSIDQSIDRLSVVCIFNNMNRINDDKLSQSRAGSVQYVVALKRYQNTVPCSSFEGWKQCCPCLRLTDSKSNNLKSSSDNKTACMYYVIQKKLERSTIIIIYFIEKKETERDRSIDHQILFHGTGGPPNRAARSSRIPSVQLNAFNGKIVVVGIVLLFPSTSSRSLLSLPSLLLVLLLLLDRLNHAKL